MSNTHGEFIKTENFSAFIDGVPDKCEHDWTGDEVLYSASGKTIYWHTYRQWASLTSLVRQTLIYNYHQEIDDPIVGGCVTCRKCKKEFYPDIHEI